MQGVRVYNVLTLVSSLFLYSHLEFPEHSLLFLFSYTNTVFSSSTKLKSTMNRSLDGLVYSFCLLYEFQKH